ncbi:hypothetical protein AAG570_000979 [Ranatra chinensis]|uniref:GPI ethanolamine phosphate transferase 1 n=1 Tax=Ranatra chinensis TaxID=642074 RepID=A0ABD0YAJ2_9HEMI
MEGEGSWGVSHSRVPTKSRQGVVAILGGIFEDPSGVMNLFKDNPVEFDHIFNHVKDTIYIGYPGMPNFFSKSKSTEKWIKYKFDNLWESITTKTNSSILDEWVFNHVDEVFKSSNDTVRNLLADERLIFCLHLAGMDLVSHIWGKVTREVIENVDVIDEGVARVDKSFEGFYKDKNTVFILTSDHGMTDWGTHGGGTRQEVEIPILAWGAGIMREGPKAATSRQQQSASPRSWRVENLTRKDIDQVDTAPLISALLGIPIPVNSVGVLPHNYLDITQKDKSITVMCNALQMMALCDKMGERIKLDVIPKMKIGNPLPELLSNEYKTKLNFLYETHEYSTLQQVSEEVVRKSQLALNFYQGYYTNMLRCALCFVFVGWSMVLLMHIIEHFDVDHKGQLERQNADKQIKREATSWSMEKLYSSVKYQMTTLRDTYNLYIFFCDTLCITLLVIFSILIQLQNWPIQFHAYLILPILLWWWVFRKYHVWLHIYRSFTITQHLVILCSALLCMAGTAYIILSINIREYMYWAVIVIAFVPVVTLQLFFIPKLVIMSWLVSSIALAVLPQFPIIKMKPDIRLVSLAGYLWIFTNGLYLYYKKVRNQNKLCLFISTFMIGLALWNVISVDNALTKKEDPMTLNYILSWSLLAVSALLPLATLRDPLERLIHNCLNLSIPFILLSVRHEAITYYFLCMYLVTWVVIEIQLSHTNKLKIANIGRKLTIHDLRRGLLFYFYIIVSFFAIGNVDHMATFEISWVRCFVYELEVFVIASLVVYKNAIVVMLTMCAVITICEHTKAKTEVVFTWLLFLNNIVSFYFFLMVRGHGSVSDISYCLAHHLFAQLIAIVTVTLYPFVNCLMQTTILEKFGTIKTKAREKYRTYFPTTNI